MIGETALARTLQRDRLIVLLALAAITALAWGYVIHLAREMHAPDGAAMPDMAGMPDMPGMKMPDSTVLAPAFAAWSATHFGLMFAMWAVMMVGMMTPSVAPMVLIYIQVSRRSAERNHAFAPAGYFTAGYLLAWCLFSALAVLAQWALERLAAITPMMVSASRPFGGAVLILAGIYQFLPMKSACLSQCRAPLAFVQRHGGFQASARGSLRLGLLHGTYCIGCCWAVMALLFVGGVMNLLWIAALMVFVLLEKLLPGARLIPPLGGVAALASGLYLVAT